MTTQRKIHLIVEHCSRACDGCFAGVPTAISGANGTRDPGEVTCKRCVRTMSADQLATRRVRIKTLNKEFRLEEPATKLHPFVCTHGTGFCDQPKCRNRYRALEWLESKAVRRQIAARLNVDAYRIVRPGVARASLGR